MSFELCDADTIGHIIFYLGVHDIYHLIFTGCPLLCLKIPPRLHFVTLTDLKRFTPFPRALFHLGNVEEIVLEMNFRHKMYPLKLSGLPMIPCPCPNLTRLHLSFRQSLSLLEQSPSIGSLLPSITDLELSQFNSDLKENHLKACPSALTRLSLTSAFSFTQHIDSSWLLHMPQTLSALIMSGFSVSKGDISFPAHLTHLNMEFGWIEAMELLPRSLETMIIRLHTLTPFTYYSSKMPPNLVSFSLQKTVGAPLMFAFDTPVPPTLTSLAGFIRNRGDSLDFDICKHTTPGTLVNIPNSIKLNENDIKHLSPNYRELSLGPECGRGILCLPARLKVLHHVPDSSSCIERIYPGSLEKVTDYFHSPSQVALLPKTLRELSLIYDSITPSDTWTMSSEAFAQVMPFQCLQKLVIGVYHFTDFQFLSSLSALTQLYLEADSADSRQKNLLAQVGFARMLPKSLRTFSFDGALGDASPDRPCRFFEWLEDFGHLSSLTKLSICVWRPERPTSFGSGGSTTKWLSVLPPNLLDLDIRLPSWMFVPVDALHNLPPTLEKLWVTITEDIDDPRDAIQPRRNEELSRLPRTLCHLTYSCTLPHFTPDLFNLLPPSIITLSLFPEPENEMAIALNSYICNLVIDC